MRKDRLFKRKSRRSFTLCISKELCWVVLRAELSITEKCWPVSHWSRSSPCLNEWSLHPQVPEPSCLLSVPSSQDVLRSPAWWRGYGWDRRNRVLDYHCCFSVCVLSFTAGVTCSFRKTSMRVRLSAKRFWRWNWAWATSWVMIMQLLRKRAWESLRSQVIYSAAGITRQRESSSVVSVTRRGCFFGEKFRNHQLCPEHVSP